MADAPRVTMTITGKMYDVLVVGTQGDEGFSPYPHTTAYTAEKAYTAFAEYAKRIAQESSADGKALLAHMQDSGVELSLVTMRILEVDDKIFEAHRSRVNIASPILYGKILAVIDRVEAQHAGAQSIQSQARSETVLPGTAPRTAAPTTGRGGMTERKPVKITTVYQGSAARDTMEDAMKNMVKAAGTGGLKEAMVMSARKSGAVVQGLNALAAEEASERESLALAGEPMDTEEHHIPLVPQGLSAGDDPMDFIMDEAPTGPNAPLPAAPAPAPVAPPIRTISGDEAETLGGGALSDTAQQARRAMWLESQAADEGVEDVVTDVFLTATRGSAADGVAATELSNQEVGHAGRTVQKTTISGTGRGGTRPKAPRR